MTAAQLENSPDIVSTVISRARDNGGRTDLIARYRDECRKAVVSELDLLAIQHHAVNFLRDVGASRWLDKPVRVLGIGRTPMPGFNSYLHLESLSGPDALMNPKYLEFLDLMGWKPASGEAWLRTMDGSEVRKHTSLLDALNVGYLLSWENNEVPVRLASDYTRYSDTATADSAVDPHEDAHLVLMRQDSSTDRVACRRRGLMKDGLEDNVFVTDVYLPEALLPGTISAIGVERKGPPGVFHTGERNFVLGVALGENLPLINRNNGSVDLPITESPMRLWMFSCADGVDHADTEYRVRINLQSVPAGLLDLTKVIDLDMNVWERDRAWPRAFFVDTLAKYDSPEVLASFLKASDGLPLAAVRADHALSPITTRQVVPASAYKISNNTTSFDIVAPSDGVIVLSEAHLLDQVYATVNDEPTDVFVVNHAFSGIHVSEPGHYRVSFSYRPPRWSLSWILSVVGIFLLAVMTYLLRRSKLESFSSDSEDQVYRESHQNQ